MVTRPAVPPYSSTTIAHCVCWRWNCFSSSGTRLVSGTTTAGRSSVVTGRASSAVLEDDEVLHEDEAGDVVERVLVDGKARVLLLEEQRAHVADGRGVADRDDVGPRRHHLADERVAEVDDALQQPALLAFDQPFLLRGVDVGLRRLVGFLGRLVRRRRRPAAPGRGHDAGDPAGHRPERAGERRERRQQDLEHALGIAAGDEQRHEQLEDEDEGREREQQRRQRVRAVDADVARQQCRWRRR